MTEQDHFWSQMIDQAITNADAEGRSQVAEFLRLRAKNDAIRHVGVTWVLNTFIARFMTPELIARGLTVERDDGHDFKHRNSTLVGSQIRFQLGVRCLSVEVGWTRMPSDGIMRGGALAVARISHFGISRESEAFSLILEEPRPLWRNVETGGAIDGSTLDRHVALLLG